jgi:hypothetical protein
LPGYMRLVVSLATLLLGLFASTTTLAAMQGDPRANITGLWSGWHQCVNTKIGTSAMISVDSAGHLIGVREFYPTPGDPARASGSFRLTGNYQPTTGAVSLMAGPWINFPTGYGKCDFVGTVDPTGSVMTGTSPGCSPCGQFELHRQ